VRRTLAALAMLPVLLRGVQPAVALSGNHRIEGLKLRSVPSSGLAIRSVCSDCCRSTMGNRYVHDELSLRATSRDNSLVTRIWKPKPEQRKCLFLKSGISGAFQDWVGRERDGRSELAFFSHVNRELFPDHPLPIEYELALGVTECCCDRLVVFLA
jgi:hypothetical protein